MTIMELISKCDNIIHNSDSIEVYAGPESEEILHVSMLGFDYRNKILQKEVAGFEIKNINDYSCRLIVYVERG